MTVFSRASRLLAAASMMTSLLSSCGGGRHVEAPGESAGSVVPTADLLAMVLEADRDFARDVAARGLEAWVAAFAVDGAMIPAGGPVLSGHPAIRETMAQEFGTPGFSLTWEPLGGDVARSGDLAYTFGNYEQKVDSEVVTRGRYLTVWRRQGDGDWQVIADIGNREQAHE